MGSAISAVDEDAIEEGDNGAGWKSMIVEFADGAHDGARCLRGIVTYPCLIIFGWFKVELVLSVGKINGAGVNGEFERFSGAMAIVFPSFGCCRVLNPAGVIAGEYPREE